MENFTFQNTTKIIFGKGTHHQAGDEIKKMGKSVLLHYGGGSIKKSGLYNEIIQSLNKAGVDYSELGGVKPNPRLSMVCEGIDICRKKGIGAILAVGGGSVIDSAKAIAIGSCYEGDVWDFFTGKAEPQKSLPVGVVLTIPAAGSESSDGAVITNEDGWYKRPSANSVLMYPKFSILNPELTYTLPKYQTICGISDIMAHIMERYFTRTRNTDFTDRLCEAALKTVINNARIVNEKPDDYNARAEIMWAGTLAHNNLLGTGRIGDWGSHMIEHELSGIYDIAHGAGLSVIFPAWMQYVYKIDINRFMQFAIRVMDVDMPFEAPEKIAQEGIRRLKSFYSEIGLPVSLRELNIPGDRFEEMAQKGVKYGELGNFKKLHKEDILKILNIAL